MFLCNLTGTSTEFVAIGDSNKATDDTNPSSIVSSSTFEQYKSKQRNNGRTGHKTHKKKYKDYLRYAWANLQTNPIETVTERATLILNKHNNNNKNDISIDGYDKINATIKSQSNTNAQSESRQRKRAQKLQTEKSRGLPIPPIFMITSNQQENNTTTTTTARPFYEGQINYYLETMDENENVDQQRHVNDSKSDSLAWYRRTSPMLRNGLRRTEAQRVESNYINHMYQNVHNPRQQHYQHKNHEHQGANRYHHKHQQIPHQHTHHFSHALHQRHHHHHHKNNHPHLHHHNTHQNQARAQKILETQTAYPAGTYKQHSSSGVLGHQITDVEDFERYYAKWPHLARVQFQVYDEHLREAKEKQKASEEAEYPEYEYGSLAEMEEAQKAKPEEENLPPYVRKYNRRNKQLLDLLEGPLPPPKGYHWSGSKLQPGPAESSDNAQIIRLDDDYMREKRKRHQLLYGNNNSNNNNNNNNNNHFFAQQRKNFTDLATEAATNSSELSMSNNHLPDELAKVNEQQQQQQDQEQEQQPLQEEMASELKTHVHKLIGNEPQMSWQIEKLLMPTTTTTTQITPKALVFRLPTFNNNNHVSHAALRQRSRSAHTAGSIGQRRYMSGLLDSMELHGFADETESANNNQNAGVNLDKQTTTTPTTTTTTAAATTTTSAFAYTSSIFEPKPTGLSLKMPTMPPRSISAFVYHRVVDNTPRQVGSGGNMQGRKQQLPFVAITDRRLETFKKSLLARQKEFEQNNFPPLP